MSSSTRMPLVSSPVPLPSTRLCQTHAFRTSDWDKPNCRAIRAGVMPALKAARTAFSCPRVNESADSGFGLGGRLSVGVVCLPLRFASARVTTSRRSSSSSLRCLTAFGRSLGRTCRPSCDDEICFGAEGDRSSMPPLRRDRDSLGGSGLVPCGDDALAEARWQIPAGWSLQFTSRNAWTNGTEFLFLGGAAARS